jgi:hypothetical protein
MRYHVENVKRNKDGRWRMQGTGEESYRGY